VQINIINSGLMAHNFGIAKLSQQSLDLMKQTMLLPDRVKHIPHNDNDCQWVTTKDLVTFTIEGKQFFRNCRGLENYTCL
jgi:propanediol utilization protein